jgi:hypothetical protein
MICICICICICIRIRIRICICICTCTCICICICICIFALLRRPCLEACAYLLGASSVSGSWPWDGDRASLGHKKWGNPRRNMA